MKNKMITRRWIASGIMLVLGLLLFAASSALPSFADGYANTVYRFTVAAISSVTGLFPFSVYEIIILLTIAAALFGLGRLIVSLIRRKGRRLYTLASCGATVLTVASAIFLVFMLNSGINYHRSGFAAETGLEARDDFTREELLSTLVYLNKGICENAALLETDANGACAPSDTLRADAVAAMKGIAERYSCLDFPLPLPKPVICSYQMGMAGISGIFSPFTIEANYNTDNATYCLPFTLCHELAHICGFMDEKEANFIAYLACINSDSAYFRYSGYLCSYYYCLCDFDYISKDEYIALQSALPDIVWCDYAAESAYWNSFYSEEEDVVSVIGNGINNIVSDISSTVNDTYLNLNGIDGGSASYGKVSWLIAADYVASH